MSGRGTTVARALRMPIPILARKLTQRGRALTHRLMADTTWRTDGVTPELLRALRDGGHSRFFVHPADRSAVVAAGRGPPPKSAKHTSELHSPPNLRCPRLL